MTYGSLIYPISLSKHLPWELEKKNVFGGISELVKY